MAKHVFCSPTEEDIETQFSRWMRDNGEAVSDVKRRPIVRRPIDVQRAGFEHRPVNAPNTFSMLVEYESKLEPRHPRHK
jgi:hypothetical protein